jgi:hypothetical protein
VFFDQPVPSNPLPRGLAGFQVAVDVGNSRRTFSRFRRLS